MREQFNVCVRVCVSYPPLPAQAPPAEAQSYTPSPSAAPESSPTASPPGPRSSRGYLGERIRAWEGRRGLSFLQNMELRGGELLYIYKKMSSYTVPILLMKSSRSVCWPRGPEPGLFSLHQAGTAFLQPADRLFITVSNISAMEMDGRASYFGAFIVG
ncbi:hypothetical protein JOQ06_029250 [Pogonophryne albipinna]|uniref:THD domain-containing protein n=1 Tax=Pogonophryne albipinna TaxID=1090488 RepID=A0AAD6B9L4_9TELE|nr:hypothetical protein JOQ06_029250 [Pogonophryne albipinna]